MTGFGRAEKSVGEKTFIVEIKALNGKQFELQLKLPPMMKAYELDIRNQLQESLIRGTIDCMVSVKQNGAAKPVVINTELINAYYQQLHQLAVANQLSSDGLLGAILRLPEVVMPATDMMPDSEYEVFAMVLQQALFDLNKHREEEGQVIAKDLKTRIEKIFEQEKHILQFEPNRMIRIREEIEQLLKQHVGQDNIDRNRLEQELIYYMEKIDIHEEQIRLRQHCQYFEEILISEEVAKGKKLSFVLQEIGREINTTGSKAYDANIQKCVVVMKDELEKAKEQILNVL